jgi:small multidrug resistance family-3 protein
MTVARSILLFILAAVAEIGGAWLIWQGLYGFVATLQPDAHFGRILAAYGGVFVAGSSPGAWRSTDSGQTDGM